MVGDADGHGIADEYLSEKDGLRLFNAFLKTITQYILSPDYCPSRLRGTIAKVSRELPIFMSKEGEAYGMTKSIYTSMMVFKGNNRALFDSMLTMGNFSFDGPSVYEKRRVVIVIPDGKLTVGSFIPPSFMGEIEEIKDEVQESGVKRKKSPGERGPGKGDFKSKRTAHILSKQIHEDIVRMINENLKSNSNENNKKEIIRAALNEVKKHFDCYESKQNETSDASDAVVHSAQKYLSCLRRYGGRFSQTQETIDTIITALVSNDVTNIEIEKLLCVPRKRIATARERRLKFDKLAENAADVVGNQINDNTSDSTVNTEEDQWSLSSSDDDGNSIYSGGDIDVFSTDVSSISTVAPAKEKPMKKNVFRDALNFRVRKIRKDKLNLEVVRDFCHDVCRLDTFNSGHKIHVHNYDGSYDYHQIHIRNQSLKEYYKMFETSQIYGLWQRENKRMKNGFEIFPVIKYRSFTNAFCPCCLNQKQRDCANHVQVSLVNALKALGNMRRLRGVADAIKSCNCVGHSNENYMRCHTSLHSFIGAVSCAEIEHPSLSCKDGQSICIKEQELNNIKASNEKESKKGITEKNINRNIKREGPAKQRKSIHLVSWGGLFSCNKKECAYQECLSCGVDKFFNENNLCNAERNSGFTVIVRKYENVPGRSRGMQMEIVEVSMNGVELIQHLIQCAKVALPHEFNIKWNTHGRQMCMNTYEEGCLNIMTDFSAVLDHDVQDRLNTAIPCHTNQCVLLACHSPRYVALDNGRSKRIQTNDVWHGWSAQGGTLEANSYYHSVFMRHVLHHYEQLEIKRVNVFTDGCAEQYKSRRNAYFIAELAKESNSIITHNYAPTASFKTMVDGQGDLTKSTYRALEKNEIEGTRCPTSYDLFKLFTSDYPMIPVEVPDDKKRLMTISNRMHRFLVDKADSTAEMNARAESEKDVIITDYIGERWDAPTLRGIKSIFCLIGKTVDSQAKLYSRAHTCFCQSCMKGDFERCSEVLTVGILKEELVSKLPYKVPTPAAVKPTESVMEKINHFKNVFDNAGNEQVIVAIIKETTGDHGEAFELAIMTKGVK